MKNIKLMLMAFAAVLLTSATVFAQAPQKGTERGNSMVALMAQELDLTDEQVELVTTIQQEFREKMRALRTSSNGDREAIKTEMQKLSGEQEAALKAVFSEEQVTKWESLRAERMGKRPRPGGMNPKGVRPNKMERPTGTQPKGKQPQKLEQRPQGKRPTMQQHSKGKSNVKRPTKGAQKPRATRADKLKQDLGLSDAQAKELKELNKAHKAKIKELKANGKERKIKRVNKKHRATVKKSLTPEQFEKWTTMKAKKKGIRGQRK